VLRCRGQFRAECFPDIGGRVVALAPLLVLRLREEAVLPGYLAFFLNAPGTRARMEAAARGSAIQFLGKAEVERIDVPIPSLRHQQAAVEYAALAERERTLSARLHGLRLRMMDAILDSGSGDAFRHGRI
jgi:restriction endonuclease S subunit